MAFNSVIYEVLKERDAKAAASFSRDYKAYIGRRTSLPFNAFHMVSNYFFSVFSINPGNFQRELRCIAGNRIPHLWLEDFRNVVAESYIANYDKITITSRETTANITSELGELIGAN